MLRESLTIQSNTPTQGPGGEEDSWSDVQSVSARVIPVRAAVKAEYQRMGSRVDFRVSLKDDVALAYDDYRFVWTNNGNKILLPVGPPYNPGGADRWTVMDVAEEETTA